VITLLKVRPYTGDVVVPSPNHGVRKALAIHGIVLHATTDEGDEARSLSWMRSPRSRVSCHLLVSRAGRVTRLVGDQQRAWHAGVSWWRGTSDVNSITLGIEIANRNNGEPFTEAQYSRVVEIVVHYCRQGLSIEDVVGHRQIANGRRTDPRGWDWVRFREMVQHRLGSTAVLPAVVAPTQTTVQRREVLAQVPAVVSNAIAAGLKGVPVITTAKPVLYSRTFWLNLMTVIASVALLIGDTLDLALVVGITVPENLTKWALFAIGMLNILLRLRTTQPLCWSKNVHPAPGTFRSDAVPSAVARPADRSARVAVR
jgi:N-acetyl-anhydromuramyl-L-alanine amidase AmpD